MKIAAIVLAVVIIVATTNATFEEAATDDKRVGLWQRDELEGSDQVTEDENSPEATARSLHFVNLLSPILKKILKVIILWLGIYEGKLVVQGKVWGIHPKNS